METATMAGTNSGLKGVASSLSGAQTGLGAIVLEKNPGQSLQGIGATDSAMGSALVGVATAAAGGALTGGLSAGTWQGAGIGAGINAGLWSLLTLFGSWQTANNTTKAILGATALVGGGAAGYYIYRRMKGRR